MKLALPEKYINADKLTQQRFINALSQEMKQFGIKAEIAVEKVKNVRNN